MDSDASLLDFHLQKAALLASGTGKNSFRLGRSPNFLQNYVSESKYESMISSWCAVRGYTYRYDPSEITCPHLVVMPR